MDHLQSPEPANATLTIMVVDDDDNLRIRMAKAFEKRGYATLVAACYDDVQALLENHSPDRAVLDLKMPGKSGLEILQYVADKSPSTDTVILTGYGSISNAVDAMKMGAVNYVTKPANADEVLAAFENKEDHLGKNSTPNRSQRQNGITSNVYSAIATAIFQKPLVNLTSLAEPSSANSRNSLPDPPQRREIN